MKTQAIGDLAQWVGRSVELQGWVMARRSSKDLVFLVMRDGSGLCQCVADRSTLGDAMYEEAEALTQESAFVCRGEVVADPRQIGGTKSGSAKSAPCTSARITPSPPKNTAWTSLWTTATFGSAPKGNGPLCASAIP